MSTTVPSSCTGEDVRTIYPLHCAVFNNEVESLKKLLEQEGGREKINSLDVHGRSPIMLATVLGHIECAELLLKNGSCAVWFAASPIEEGVSVLQVLMQTLKIEVAHDLMTVDTVELLVSVLFQRCGH